MSIFNGDASEFYALSADLSSIGARAVPALRSAMAQAGTVFADAWRSNAVATSGVHGKHYPNSIDSQLSLGMRTVSVEAGPNSGKPQGSMGRGFEFGSKNQPPHLDGLRAMEEIAPQVEALVASVIDGTFAAAAPSSGGSGLQEYTTRAGVTRLATSAQIANWTRGKR